MEQTEAGNIKRRVVIGMDGSQISEDAFKWYVQKFWQEDDFAIIVYTPEFRNLTHISVIAADAALVQKIVDDEKEHTRVLLDKATQLIKESGIKGVARQSMGDPGEQLIEVATTEGADMIITGSRGLGTLRRTFLGSVSDYVVHHAHIPVLVYKPAHH